MGCSHDKEITVSCDYDKDGSYLIKWEVYPLNTGDKVSIYMSDNDTVFAEPPLLVADADDCFAKISANNNAERKFFRLRINDSYSDVISNRSFKFDNVQNFRDVGGYDNKDKQQVKWSKIYRSGDFSELTDADYKKLKDLDIKTIIDFRNTYDRDERPDLFRGDSIINLPVDVSNRAYIRDKIIDGSFLRGDAILYTQDMYESILENHADAYADLFDILCNENNYPIALHGHLGKDKIGLASYFIFKALGVSTETIQDDYLLSNNQISKDQVIGEARFLPEKMQEAATVVCKVDVSYLNYAESCMIKISGSVDAYMAEKLKLTPEKKEKLKQILLYQTS